MNWRKVVILVDRLNLFFFILLYGKFDVLTSPDVGDMHLIKRESSSFIRADVCGSSHDLTSFQLLHIVIVLEHLALRVS